MKTAFLITRKLSQSEQNEISQKAENDKDISVFTTQSSGQNLTLQAKKIDLEPEAKRKINTEIFDLFKHFAQKPVNGQTFYEYFTFGKAQLWFYHKYRIFFNTRDLAYESAIIKSLSSRFDLVLVYSGFKDLSMLDFDTDRISLIFSTPKKQPLKFSAVINYFIIFMLRFFWGIINARGQDKKKLAIIDSRGQYRKMLRSDCSGFNYENAFIGYAFQYFDQRFTLIDLLILPKFNHPFPLNASYWKNTNKRPRWYEEYILFKGFGLKELRTFIEWRKILNSRLHTCNQSLQLQGLEKIIFKYFSTLVGSSLFYLAKYLAYRRFFQHRNIKVVATCDENSPNFKLILDAAKSAQVITVGYQHGNIHNIHPSYMYHEKDLKFQPMPDHTLVWGERWKNLLLHPGNFRPDMVEVIGQVRTDVIFNLQHTEHRVRNGIESDLQNKKMVLFASQPQRDHDLRYQAGLDVMEATKDLPDVLLIIKMHPLENDPEFYKDIAQRTGARNYKIVQDPDLYLLLDMADIVITCFSTVGTETVYFRKPLVILDHLREDILNYVKEGVAFQTTNAKELQECLTGILSNQLSLNAGVYDRYISEYAYKIDGQAGQRLIRFISGLIRS